MGACYCYELGIQVVQDIVDVEVEVCGLVFFPVPAVILIGLLRRLLLPSPPWPLPSLIPTPTSSPAAIIIDKIIVLQLLVGSLNSGKLVLQLRVTPIRCLVLLGKLHKLLFDLLGSGFLPGLEPEHLYR